MTATVNPMLTRAELREEYRIAVRLWSEARALYPAGSPEVSGAEEELTKLEARLTAAPSQRPKLTDCPVT